DQRCNRGRIAAEAGCQVGQIFRQQVFLSSFPTVGAVDDRAYFVDSRKTPTAPRLHFLLLPNPTFQGVDLWLSTQCAVWKSMNERPRTRRRMKGRPISSAVKTAKTNSRPLPRTTSAKRERQGPR